MIHETILSLLSVEIENTDIVGAVYEDSTNLDPAVKSVHFYRVVCHASYEEGSFARTEVWLPENWNHCLVGLGNGSLAGTIRQKKMLPFVTRGYAVAHTDMGTVDGNTRGIHNPAVWRDFGWRATHEMTVLAKKLIRFHYGTDADFSYFWGESTGGQQSMSLVQRFPHDYDGIIAGVHANNRVALHTYFLWNYTRIKRPDGSNRFTAEEITRITQYGVEFFQARHDGEKGDAFITYPWLGNQTITDFISFLREKGFNEEQLAALTEIYSGPVDPQTGKQIYCGMPIGSEKNGELLTYLNTIHRRAYPFYWVYGKDFDPFSFDFGADYQRLHDALATELNANDPNLSAFMENGGKLLAYSGSADPVVPFPDAIRYYESVLNGMGGYERVSEFYRYFIFPGKNHGATGDGANREWGDETGSIDLLDVMRAWRENGQAPEHLYAARVEDKQTVFSRKIYPYASDANPARKLMKNCEIL